MTISRSNIVDRLQYAEWVVQFAENWAALPAGAIKGKARVDIVNHVRKMVIAYCYWEIGLSQEQTAKIVGRKHPAIHHQLRVHNEAHQTTETQCVKPIPCIAAIMKRSKWIWKFKPAKRTSSI
jgi:hypothetical protein